MKYTLYHIKGVKWGCTKRTLQERFSDADYRKSGFTIEDVCETEIYYDIDIASEREKELNRMFSYVKQLTDYRTTKNNAKNMKPKIGKNNGRAKLTEQDVIEIRKKYKPRVYTLKMLCEEYNMSRDGMIDIIHRRNWTHI